MASNNQDAGIITLSLGGLIGASPSEPHASDAIVYRLIKFIIDLNHVRTHIEWTCTCVGVAKARPIDDQTSSLVINPRRMRRRIRCRRVLHGVFKAFVVWLKLATASQRTEVFA